jgi:TonB-linked SusC/RagA family outer membrane protein
LRPKFWIINIIFRLLPFANSNFLKMKTKLNGILTLLLALVVHFSFAQSKTVSGTVTDSDGLPLPGVNILVQGTTSGTQTDFDGNYSISATSGQVLVFTYIGQKEARVTVGASDTYNVQMEEDAQALEEVVVTAQGIKREKQALGYAVSTVGEDQLEQRTEGDVGRILRGKASGVNITQQSGVSGSGTNIIIRGYQSFSQNNQPLFIVDGVPFASDTNSAAFGGSGNFQNGNNGSSRFLDLDPNSIADVQVLKGLSAATLYGEQGKNGVILITTKAGAAASARKKNEITFSQSYFMNEIASMPEYTDLYGNGFDQKFGWFFSNWGPSFRKEGTTGWGNASNFPTAYGLNTEDGTILHPYSTAATQTGIPGAFPEFQGARYKWQPYNSVGEFFNTGTVLNTSLQASGSSADGKTSYNVSYGHMNDEGFTPGNRVIRNNFSVGGRAQLTNNFTFSGTMNYSKTMFKSPPVARSTGSGPNGAGSSVFGHVFFTPRSVDLMNLPYEDPVSGKSVYYRQGNDIQHPLWTVANAGNRQDTNRVFGSMNVNYDISENLNLLYRVGYDFYSERNMNFQNKGGQSGSTQTLSGIYETWDNNNMIWDHSVILNGDFDLSEDLDMTFNAGGTSRSTVYDRQGVSSSGQNVMGVLRHFNFDLQDEIQVTSFKNILGLYAQMDFGYKKYLYLTVNGRNDWVSNQSVENRSLFYKGASFSFIPTNAFSELKGDILNNLKVRGGYGESAGFANGFPTAVNLLMNTQAWFDSGMIVTNSVSNTVANPNILPELYRELEFGVETLLFDRRLSIDFSVYKRFTENLIVNKPLDPSTGGTTIQTNVGEIEGDGIELDFNLDIIRNEGQGLAWSINGNFNKNKSIVTDLGEDSDIIVYAGFTDLGNAAIVGEQLGTIVGSRVGRNSEGAFMVDGSGNYIIENSDENGQIPVIGNPNPDFIFNLGNTLSYKGLNFNVLFNHQQGGDIYSKTIATLVGRGLVTDTNDREASFILPGVDPDGNLNNRQINNSDYYFNNVAFGPSELNIYDATTVRLQEISLGYTLPQSLLENTPFGSLSFTFSGFNLWYHTFNMPQSVNFDPNVAGLGVGLGQGFDWINGPSSKRYGFSLKATF